MLQYSPLSYRMRHLRVKRLSQTLPQADGPPTL